MNFHFHDHFVSDFRSFKRVLVLYAGLHEQFKFYMKNEYQGLSSIPSPKLREALKWWNFEKNASILTYESSSDYFAKTGSQKGKYLQ